MRARGRRLCFVLCRRKQRYYPMFLIAKCILDFCIFINLHPFIRRKNRSLQGTSPTRLTAITHHVAISGDKISRARLSLQHTISPISQDSLVKHFELRETSGCDISWIREEFYSRRGKLDAATCFPRARKIPSREACANVPRGSRHKISMETFEKLPPTLPALLPPPSPHRHPKSVSRISYPARSCFHRKITRA